MGLIGAGKFGSMFLGQAGQMTGLHAVAIADLSLERAPASLARAGWAHDRIAACSIGDALKDGTILWGRKSRPHSCGAFVDVRQATEHGPRADRAL